MNFIDIIFNDMIYDDININEVNISFGFTRAYGIASIQPLVPWFYRW